jgi:glycosyltransferase involved in cell wall biosynthesis
LNEETLPFDGLRVAMIGPAPAHWGGEKWLGGVATAVGGLVPELLALGIQVDLLADNLSTGPVASPVPPGIQIHTMSRSAAGLLSLAVTQGGPMLRRVITAPDVRRAMPQSALLRLLGQALNYGSFLRSRPADLLHVHHARQRLYACRELLQVGLPVVATVQSANLLVEDVPPWLRRMVIDNYRRADRFIAVSHYVQGQMAAHGADPAQVTVIPNGVDPARFHPADPQQARAQLGLAPEDFLILFTGSLIPRKGTHHLLHACRDLFADHPGARLLLVGSGSERGNLEDLAAELGIAARVDFVGQRPYLELAAWYQAADAYVLASSAEGLSLALLEAMACACPVITTRPAESVHDAVRDGDTGLLVEWGRPTAITQALRRLITSPGLRMGLGQAGRRAVEESFSWPVIAAQTGAVYRQAIEARESGR